MVQEKERVDVFYNEFESYPAAWLRILGEAGELPAGVVDERSITDLDPDDLAGYRQCHFFAGIGGWPYALRLAGWPEEREVWTGSCPCQPLSSAGQHKGHADERHLWPAFYRLIAERRPATVFGEQVASKDGREWLAGVRADLEELGYAVGAADLCAASVGAPHIRQRLFWYAQRLDDTAGARCDGARPGPETAPRDQARLRRPERGCADGGMAYAERGGQLGPGDDQREYIAARRPERLAAFDQRQSCQGYGGEGGTLDDTQRDGRRAVGDDHPWDVGNEPDAAGGELGDALAPRLPASECEALQGARRQNQGRATAQPGAFRGSANQRLGDAAHNRRGEECALPGGGGEGDCPQGRAERFGIGGRAGDSGLADTQRDDGRPDIAGRGPQGRTAHFWDDSYWLLCLDGKARRVGTGVFPLAHGTPARVGRLRAYGNAIVPQVAAEFIRAVMEVMSL